MPNNDKKFDNVPGKDQGGIDNKDQNCGKPAGKGKGKGSKKGGKGGGKRPPRRQDPFWYSKDAATIQQMGSIPWTEVVGSEFDDSIEGSVPAAIIYPVYHSVGNEWVEDANSLTRAANKYFQYLTQGFTGSVDFEAPDLLMTAIAACSLNALFKEGMRAFGYANSFSGLNKYRPYAVLEALGFNPNMFNGKSGHTKADFVTDYNIRVDQFNDLIALPSGMFLRDRWDFMSSGLFSDNDQDEYNTIQAYVTEAFLEYDGTSSITGTCLKWYTPRNSVILTEEDHSVSKSLAYKFTYDTYFEAIDHLLSALTSDDCRNMFGALRRVYSDAQFYKIQYLSADFTESVVRNDIVSVQLHNAECWDYVLPTYDDGVTFTTKRPVIYQTSDGQVICSTWASLDHQDDENDAHSGNFYPANKILDSFAVEPTAGNVLDMIAHLNAVNDNMSYDIAHPEDRHSELCIWPVSGRSELLRMPWIYTSVKDTDGIQRKRFRVAVKNLLDNDSTTLTRATHVNSMTFIRTFDRVNDSSSEMYWPHISGIYGEIDKYTIVAERVLISNMARSTFFMVQMPKNQKSITK